MKFIRKNEKPNIYSKNYPVGNVNYFQCFDIESVLL